jgi:hypothetical protein
VVSAFLHDAVLHHFLLGHLNEAQYLAEWVHNAGEWRRDLGVELWRQRASSGTEPAIFSLSSVASGGGTRATDRGPQPRCGGDCADQRRGKCGRPAAFLSSRWKCRTLRRRCWNADGRAGWRLYNATPLRWNLRLSVREAERLVRAAFASAAKLPAGFEPKAMLSRRKWRSRDSIELYERGGGPPWRLPPLAACFRAQDSGLLAGGGLLSCCLDLPLPGGGGDFGHLPIRSMGLGKACHPYGKRRKCGFSARNLQFGIHFRHC